MCATPGKDGVDTGILSIVNSYFPGTGSINAGATSITVGPINAAGNQTTISAGDLLLVIQMQDADINFSDTSNYGAGTGTGSGATNLNNTGRYEYVVALNSVGTGGGIVQIRGGSGGGLIHGYRQRTANVTSNGKSTYQIIRVPQYTDVSLSGTIRAPGAWNGTSGGIVALDVAGTFTMNNGQIDVKDKGFRGGGGTTNSDTYPLGEDESYRTSGVTPRGGMKGEGIAGTPLITFNGQEVNGIGIVNTMTDGYPRLQSQDDASYRSTTTSTANGGSRGRGAPGNAGGGGNQHNAGGGGGGNRGVGGQGGNSINSPPATEIAATGVSKPVGGRGGSVFPSALDRIIMGGGGGAGDANNGIAGSGGPGGGIVMVRTGSITGSGVISATAKDGGITPTDDGGAGAGAGGSIVIAAKSGSLSGITLTAQGGKGGDVNTATSVPYDFGPGGGGGGGVIFSSLPTGTTNVLGGQPGKSFNGQLGGTTGVTRGAQAGTEGQVVTSVTATQIPGIQSGADCSATLSGLVWDDLDGSITQAVGETGTNAGGLYAYAVNGSGEVVARATVQATGAYSLLVPNNASYTLRLSTDGSRNPGQAAPAPSLPNGWNNTGENLNGTPETITPGEIAVTVGTSNITNQNFGIRQEASPAAGKIVINEVLFRQTNGSTAAANDEFIELYNASNTAIDMSGWKLLDGNLITNDTDGNGGINGGAIGGASAPFVFPVNTIVNPGAYVVVWVGSETADKKANDAAFQFYLGQSASLNNAGDDMWLYDANTRIVDYMAYGSNNGINTPPIATLNLWNNTYQSAIANTSQAGQSISLTPNGLDGNTSACWEATTSNSASGRCPGALPTRDTDAVVNRITSVGVNNNGNASVLLVKRITAINGLRTNPNDGTTRLDQFVDDVTSTHQADDNATGWPVGYLKGQFNAGPVKPGDTLEYTVYFLSNGAAPAEGVRVCDRIQLGQAVQLGAYGGGDAQIQLGSSSPLNLTAAIDGGDRTQFIPANSAVPANCNLKQANDNGTLMIDITGSTGAPTLPNLPRSTGAGAPNNSYGFFRFVTKVDE